jgi:hypothetical protein
MEMLMWLDMVVRYGVGNRHPCPDGCRSSLGVLGLVARHDIDKKIKDLGARDSGDDAGLLQRAALVLLCAHPTGSRMNISQARVKTTGALVAIMRTSSSTFMIFLMRGSGRLWFLKSVVASVSRPSSGAWRRDRHVRPVIGSRGGTNLKNVQMFSQCFLLIELHWVPLMAY